MHWFDFGDNWWHQIDVLAIDDTVPKGNSLSNLVANAAGNGSSALAGTAEMAAATAIQGITKQRMTGFLMAYHSRQRNA